MTIERIIVGVDGSVPSRAAIRWSVERARLHESGVVLVHVMDDEWGAIGSQLIAEANRGSVDMLDAGARMVHELSPETPITVELLYGSPMWELAQLSNETTLVVVGTHKTGFHYGRAFGSRSLQLASLASGPIAVVPESWVRLRRGVVVGIDDTTAGRNALAVAANEADRADSELILVRALDTSAPDYLGEDDKHSWQEAARCARAPRTRGRRQPGAGTPPAPGHTQPHHQARTRNRSQRGLAQRRTARRRKLTTLRIRAGERPRQCRLRRAAEPGLPDDDRALVRR